ncbi:MAG: proline dehydrogenase [Chitinophagia bacterium]|nr:proline dehydrogenase [Chitinophagia bacterium]
MLPQFNDTEIAFKHQSNRALKQAHFLFSAMGNPLLTKLGILATQWAFKLHLPIQPLIKRTIFKQFCGGETMQEAAQTAQMLHQFGVGVILDYGVEGKDSETAFDAAVPEFIKAIEYAATQANIPFISAKITGFARFALLEKINHKETLNTAEEAEWQRIIQRMHQICQHAKVNNIMLLIDAEESWIQQPVDDITDLMMATYNTEKVIVFNTFQMYRHDRFAFLKSSHQKALAGNYKLGAKLVRGAANKEASDNDYNAAVDYCLDHLDSIVVFIGTHNEKSCFLAAEKMQHLNLSSNHPHVYFSQLYGMSDNISFNLANGQYNISKYLPYGPVKDVIPYLMRRAQENTSVAGQTGRELSLIKTELKRRKLN